MKVKLLFLAGILGFLALLGLSTKLSGKPSLDVYILAGQSNMTGNGNNADLPAQFQGVQQHLIAVGGTVNIPLTNLAPGQGNNANAFGVEVPIGTLIPNKSAFLKFAMSGTSLGADWAPGSTIRTNFYKFLGDNIALLSQSYDVNLKGFVWVQGENDAMDQNLANAYLTNLVAFFSEVRTTLNAPNMQIVLSDVNQNIAYASIVRGTQHVMSVMLPSVKMVSTAGFATFDGLHYTSANYLALGLELGEALMTVDPIPADAPLLNMSTRVTVHASDGPLTMGFVVGQTSKLIVRGIGPNLLNYGVSNAMKNPTIKLFQNSNQIGSVTGWNPVYSYTFGIVGAGPLTVGSADSALVIELQPGVYSVQLSDLNGVDGNAMVELFLVK